MEKQLRSLCEVADQCIIPHVLCRIIPIVLVEWRFQTEGDWSARLRASDPCPDLALIVQGDKTSLCITLIRRTPTA